MRQALFTLLLSGAMLSGCTSTLVENAEPIPELTFAQIQTIPVNVSRIKFSTQPERGAALWDIANDLPTPPNTAMNRYLTKRFKASGTDGVLGINLQKAQILSEDVPHENMILSYVPLANVVEYTFDIVVGLDVAYIAGQADTTTTKRFMRKVRMPVNATMSYRESRLQRTLEEVMRDVDESLVRTLSHDFNLIAERNMPKKNLPIKTQLPETETEVGIHWKDFKKEVSKAADKVEETFEEHAPQSITPRAVTSEPLNN
ncbi:MAG: hypothetical protein COB76_05590 [Alphaproteobacteria bacterium]|nr:MAG: hypothetical protein COB76_05590 [Alphaproteobacteria bacterium]